MPTSSSASSTSSARRSGCLKDKKIAVWGMTFKPDTDDVRNSVAIELVNRLVAEGAHVTAYDPKGAEKAVEWKLIDSAKVKLAPTPLEAVHGRGSVDPRDRVEGVCELRISRR